MLVAYAFSGGSLRPVPLESGEVPPAAIWIDLVSPTPSEDAAVERSVGVEVPTREEMRKIEPSSRLYVEDAARYMTLSVLCTDDDGPRVTPVTFILVDGRLVTVRYADPRAFALLAGRLGKSCPAEVAGDVVLMELLETLVDKIAEALEGAGEDIELLSRRIFERDRVGSRNRDYRAILTLIGRKEGLTSYVREALASVSRLVAFLGTTTEDVPLRPAVKRELKSMARDVQGLSDYANFLGNKLQFMLDGTVGLVSLEQNNIIKIFAVLSVIFMPPTLIASIYGMNFEHMPELGIAVAYPIALVAMVVSAILPYVFFKWRGWL
ncbi:magnesium transporter CorA family protein [Aquabacter spiritensis]|uniref:Magnesium transport protein CorA n=1 Tax=Aquabacter spiritensis TaxID=933073 RepID=A0A4R3LS05_9HYPH|nr:magnesium transporter CorA family protein [Aquabacter spiritensis]TCT03323.1 magnesium transporter [Aquabacter spiritensis]